MLPQKTQTRHSPAFLMNLQHHFKSPTLPTLMTFSLVTDTTHPFIYHCSHQFIIGSRRLALIFFVSIQSFFSTHYCSCLLICLYVCGYLCVFVPAYDVCIFTILNMLHLHDVTEFVCKCLFVWLNSHCTWLKDHVTWPSTMYM